MEIVLSFLVTQGQKHEWEIVVKKKALLLGIAIVSSRVGRIVSACTAFSTPLHLLAHQQIRRNVQSVVSTYTPNNNVCMH